MAFLFQSYQITKYRGSHNKLCFLDENSNISSRNSALLKLLRYSLSSALSLSNIVTIIVMYFYRIISLTNLSAQTFRIFSKY